MGNFNNSDSATSGFDSYSHATSASWTTRRRVMAILRASSRIVVFGKQRNVGALCGAGQVSATLMAIGVVCSTNAFAAPLGPNAVAVGPNAAASGVNTVAVGNAPTATNQSAIAIGTGAAASGSNATINGFDGGAIAIGQGTVANGQQAVALGNGGTATGDQAIALGTRSSAGGQSSAALGELANASNTYASAFGFGAQATGNSSVANGSRASAAGAFGTAIGGLARADTFLSTAIGASAIAVNSNDVALGALSLTSTTVGTNSATINGITFNGFAGVAPTSTVSIGRAGSERTLTNLAAGRISATSTDAVNGSQLFLIAQQATAAQTHYYSVNDGGTPRGNYANNGATGANSLAAGADASTTGQGAVAVGGQATGSGNNSVAVGRAATVSGAESVAVGPFAASSGSLAVAVGSNSSAAGGGSVAVGANANTADGVTGTAVGYSSYVGANGGTALGWGAAASNAETVAIGHDTQDGGANGVLVGTRAKAVANATALGYQSIAANNGDVALGAGSISATSTGVGFVTGSAAPASVISIGSVGGERRLTNLSAGSAATDAVNVSQLRQVANNTAAALGGGTNYDASGNYTGPTYVVNGNTYNNVGDALQSVNTQASKGFNLSANGGPAINIAPGATMDVAALDANTSVTLDPNSNRLTIGVVQNPNFTSVTTGGTTMNGGGVFVANGPSLTTTGINAGGQTITNVKAGVNGTDAVNVDQLNAVSTVAGKGFNVTTAATGTGTVSGTTVANLTPGATQTITAGNNIAVTQNGTDLTIATNPNLVADSLTTGNTVVNNAGVTLAGGPNNAVTLTNTGLNNGNNTITGVAAGAVSATSTEAVNGSQLFATNINVSNVANRVTNLTNSIQNGTAGLVQQTGGAPGSGQITVGGQTGGNSVTFANATGGDRTLTGVASGVASNDAVNVSQLRNAVAANDFPIRSGSAGAIQTTATGAGALAAGKTANASAAAATALGENSAASATGSVAIGQGANASRANSVALGTGSTTTRGAQSTYAAAQLALAQSSDGEVSVGSAGHERQITNVAAGSAGTDAVNVNQLNSVAGVANNAVQYDRNANGTPNRTSVTFNPGGSASQLHNIAAGTAGTDAVNVSQLNAGLGDVYSRSTAYTDGRINALNFDLKRVARRAYAGTASAIALQPPALFEAGQTVMRLGTGIYRGEVAFGASLRSTADNGRWSLTAGVSGGRNAGVAASAGVDFVIGH